MDLCSEFDYLGLRCKYHLSLAGATFLRINPIIFLSPSLQYEFCSYLFQDFKSQGFLFEEPDFGYSEVLFDIHHVDMSFGVYINENSVITMTSKEKLSAKKSQKLFSEILGIFQN